MIRQIAIAQLVLQSFIALVEDVNKLIAYDFLILFLEAVRSTLKSLSALFPSNNIDILILLESHPIPQSNMAMVFLRSSHYSKGCWYYQKSSAEYKSNHYV